MAESISSKIIARVAGAALKPHGIVRKGRSRKWLDDQGWFSTIIDFVPHPREPATTFVDVAACFHWYEKDYWSFDIGHLQTERVTYENDEQFTHEIERLATIALDRTFELREQLRDLHVAYQTVLDNTFVSEQDWGSYHKAVIAGLVGNSLTSQTYFDRILTREPTREWQIKLDTVATGLRALSSDTPRFRATMQDTIETTRRLKGLADVPIDINSYL